MKRGGMTRTVARFMRYIRETRWFRIVSPDGTDMTTRTERNVATPFLMLIRDPEPVIPIKNSACKTFNPLKTPPLFPPRRQSVYKTPNHEHADLAQW